MATADRIFSFRAPGALSGRIASARTAYARLSTDPALASHVSRELELELLRRLRASQETRDGAFARELVDAFVTVVERVERDTAHAPQLAAFDAEDTAGDDERRAHLRASVPSG